MKNPRSPFRRRDLLKGAGSSTALLAPPNAQSQNRPKDAKVKIGVVGGGFGSAFQWHLAPDCSVVAVCDIRNDRLQRLSEVYRCPNTYKDFQTMLKHPGLNVVAVFTPAPLHVWMAVESMKAGKHILSAVPAGMSIPELEELLDTVKRTGLRYMMAETSYYRPEVVTDVRQHRESHVAARHSADALPHALHRNHHPGYG